MTLLTLAGVLALVCVTLSTAQAKDCDNDGRCIEQRVTQAGVQQHRAVARLDVRHSRRHRAAHGTPQGLITVSTAAGIDITVAPSFAPRIQGFIGDLVARGYRPSRIGCYSTARSHVRNSNHFWGGACDFNQRGWGKTDRPMYRVADIARKWGLRDGCTFRDCGHIDMPRNYARVKRPHYASALH